MSGLGVAGRFTGMTLSVQQLALDWFDERLKKPTP
jgi:hypothetical protein